MLNSGQVDSYREHGYLMVPDLLDASELAEVRREVDRIIESAQGTPTFDHHSNGVFCGAFNLAATATDPAKAVRLTGRAGSASVHHVRLAHGSDLNRTPRPRRLLFYELAAADAWPLCGTTTKFTDLESFNAKMVAGTPTTLPRMRDIPIRIPLPKHDISSIYNAQKQAESRFFSQYAQEPDAR